MKSRLVLLTATSIALAGPALRAGVELIARGSLSGTASDLSGLSAPLENGVAGNLLGGIGSGLAWAGGNTFLALPDRGPNATPWNSNIDDTSSYIARYQTMTLALTASNGALPFTLTPTLNNTTLLYSSTPLVYAAPNAANQFIGGAPALNDAQKNYFTGRSDNFGPGSSSNSNNARLDPESIRVSPDGKSVYVSDEYGPYVYQFDRATGERTKVFTLPSNLAAVNVSAQGATEIAGNSVGRIANKGMEGLALTPDGKTLFGFMQSPLEQDSVGGAGNGRANRVVSIDLATGTTHEYTYDNKVGSKTYNSSEILALNDHEFLVLERDGKGLGDGSSTSFKSIYKVDFTGATDITNLSGESNIIGFAPPKSLFLDIRSSLNAAGIADNMIPAKLEGMAFGEDVLVNGVLEHTLYIGNDNDFLSSVGGRDNPNQWFVFGVTDADLAGSVFQNEQISAVPEPSTFGIAGLSLLAGVAYCRSRRRKI